MLCERLMDWVWWHFGVSTCFVSGTGITINIWRLVVVCSLVKEISLNLQTIGYICEHVHYSSSNRIDSKQLWGAELSSLTQATILLGLVKCVATNIVHTLKSLLYFKIYKMFVCLAGVQKYLHYNYPIAWIIFYNCSIFVKTGISGWWSPKMVHDVIMNRTINLKGGLGKNIAMDRVCEFMNAEFKGKMIWPISYTQGL